jgi:hypothetical protein
MRSGGNPGDSRGNPAWPDGILRREEAACKRHGHGVIHSRPLGFARAVGGGMLRVGLTAFDVVRLVVDGRIG